MTIQLLLVPASAGKTTYVLNLVRNAAQGLRTIRRVVVPTHLQARAWRRRLLPRFLALVHWEYGDELSAGQYRTGCRFAQTMNTWYHVCIILTESHHFAHNRPHMMATDTYDKLYGAAEAQAGYFTPAQAIAAGLDRSQLSRQVAAGRLLRVRSGVYRLVHYPASPHEDLVIAWLATGLQSAISHDSALALHDLSDALPTEIHVTVPRTASRRRSGMRLHTNRITDEEITHRAGVAVTTVPRTVADVAAAGMSDELVIQAAREAVFKGLVTPGELVAAARSKRVQSLLRRALQETGSR